MNKLPIYKKTISLALAVLLFLGGPWTAQATAPLPQTLVPLGQAVGVRLQSDGVMVVCVSPVTTEKGSVYPARDAGVAVGDIISHINGAVVNSVEDLQKQVHECRGAPLTLTVRKGNGQITKTVQPQKTNPDEQYKMGVWVRDHMAGIGTLTFYDPQSGFFGALGHGVNEMESGRLMPLKDGALVSADIKEVRRGEMGKPGELKGKFPHAQEWGVIKANTQEGIFGVVSDASPLQISAPLPVMQPAQARLGPAIIYSNVEGTTIESFTVSITKLASGTGGKSFMFEVTDPALIAKTGGIVQGMSGSPIIQDGQFLGAVTHVLVSDPQKGYGIYISAMWDAGKGYFLGKNS